MIGTEYRCPCGRAFSAEIEEETLTCPECGNSLSVSQEKDPARKIYTDSYIEAAYEVLAEEGAVWSGAR